MVHKVVGAMIGVCASCHQRSELHEHPATHQAVCENCLKFSPCQNCNRYAMLTEDPNDHRLVCGDCVTAVESQLGEQLRAKAAEQQTPQTARRQLLLDYIVTNAGPDWIAQFVKQRLLERERQLIYENKWIDELEHEPNERVLLRIATELGYHAERSLSRKPLPVDEAPEPLPRLSGRRTKKRGQTHGADRSDSPGAGRASGRSHQRKPQDPVGEA